MHAGFVSIGQLIKFAYDATGVLPRKRAGPSGLGEKDVKRIQKQLERLVDEEGALFDRCGELISSLSYELAGSITNPKVNCATGEALLDLLEVYNNVVRTEGTYLPPKESVKWFCGAYAIPRLVVSINKHYLRFNVAGEGLSAPAEPDWYLPSISNGEIVWPLKKAMHWAYDQCRINRTQFFSAGRLINQGEAEVHQNIENAFNWENGESFPSWHGLFWTFSRSIDRLANSNARNCGLISHKDKESILYVLFFARMSTYVAKKLYDAYGLEYLKKATEQFSRHQDWLAKELEELKQVAPRLIDQDQLSVADADAAWFHLSDAFWTHFVERGKHCGDIVQRTILSSGGSAPSDTTVDKLAVEHGDYWVRSLVDAMRWSSHQMPDRFGAAFFAGEKLKNSDSTRERDVDSFQVELNAQGLRSTLEWMVHWIRAVVAYRGEQYETAFVHIQEAFRLAKYSAGNRQYQIVNQYIELAAKTDRWKEFKKGIAWASYLQIPVRWLRSKDQTEANLRHAFSYMKVARYHDF